MENLEKLINELRKLPTETPWVEFKHNNYDPKMIGQNISALANGAALHEKNFAYMLWGINNESREVVGTDYNLQTLKKGNQELESWLRLLLSKNADFEFHSVKIEKMNVGVLIINSAANQTVTFERTDYIKVGSYTKKLNEFPALQAQLWDRIRNIKFEERYVKQDLGLSEALRFLDWSSYFYYRNVPQPTDTDGIAHYMIEEGVLVRQDNGLYSITNLG
jgi:predicted HTH transcriptional regulator